MKNSLIIAIIEEGTPNISMIIAIKTFKTIVQAGDKGYDKKRPPWLTVNNGTSKGDFKNSFQVAANKQGKP